MEHCFFFFFLSLSPSFFLFLFCSALGGCEIGGELHVYEYLTAVC